VAGGRIAVPIAGDVDILGLQRTRTIIQSVAARLPADSPERIALGQVERFSRLAAENLDVSRPILATIGSPVRVRQTVIEGSSTTLDAFAVAVSVTISLMFVTLLLASGMLALEREEHTVGRLVRGLVSRTGLLVEKGLLAALCATLVTFAMAAGLAAFVGLDWSRAPWWLLALAAALRPFAAMGLALGALAREIRARRCSPSCCRCRSPSSRSCRRARCPSGSTTRSPRCQRRSRSSRRCARSTAPSTAARCSNTSGISRCSRSPSA
jgi:ABC-2 type transport system permease protein